MVFTFSWWQNTLPFQKETKPHSSKHRDQMSSGGPGGREARPWLQGSDHQMAPQAFWFYLPFEQQMPRIPLVGRHGNVQVTCAPIFNHLNAMHCRFLGSRWPPACEHTKRDVELGLGIPAHSGQQSPPLPVLGSSGHHAIHFWPCQWPGRCVYSTGTWRFAQCALSHQARWPFSLDISGSTKTQTRHHGRQGVVSFCFTLFPSFVLELQLLRAGFLSGGEQGLFFIAVRGLLGVVVSPAEEHRL